MYEMKMKSKMLDVLNNQTAPQEHKDLAANILKFLSDWSDKGLDTMGDYLADAVWKGMSSLREVDGRVEYVPEENPAAPEWNSWAWVRARKVAPVVSTTLATPPQVEPIEYDF
jgi:hypothetical protein